MKHPFWLLNDALLLLFFVVLAFIFIAIPTIPKRISLKPESEVKTPKKDVSGLDLSKIYMNDLFGTYQQPSFQVAPIETKVTIPEPPMPQPVRVPIASPPKFLEPLQITLKGILTVNNETENIAIIQEAKATTAKNYMIGDKIEDAQLIRILRNKIMLLRSNGQLETLYVSQYDAELEQQLLAPNDWTSVIQKMGENSYAVDPASFTKHISNLSQCIDALNLITVYKQGKSIGCRVGALQPKSIGLALGLQQGDIITSINGIPSTTTDSRFEIYQKVIAMNIGDVITLHLIRNNQEITLQYTLQTIEKTATTPGKETTGLPIKSAEQIEAERIEILRQRQQFAPTLEELRMRQKRDIVQYGSTSDRQRNMLTNSVPLRT